MFSNSKTILPSVNTRFSRNIEYIQITCCRFLVKTIYEYATKNCCLKNDNFSHSESGFKVQKQYKSRVDFKVIIIKLFHAFFYIYFLINEYNYYYYASVFVNYFLGYCTEYIGISCHEFKDVIRRRQRI